jgi:quercetin dioxygenase-like cupin family protein
MKRASLCAALVLLGAAAHASETDKAILPEHKRPFPRYAYVLAGTLRITNTETGHSDVYRTGDFIIEAIGQWHKATSLDDRPVKLLVIDQVAGDLSNVVMRK